MPNLCLLGLGAAAHRSPLPGPASEYSIEPRWFLRWSVVVLTAKLEAIVGEMRDTVVSLAKMRIDLGRC